MLSAVLTIWTNVFVELLRLLFNNFVLIVGAHLVLILLVFGILKEFKAHKLHFLWADLSKVFVIVLMVGSYLFVSRVLEVLVVLVVVLDLFGRERVLCIDMIKVTIVVLLIL